MSIQILKGDCRAILPTLPADSVHCVVTSPPYWGLRSYLPDGHADKPLEIGLEETMDSYLDVMTAVCRELRRVLKPSGTFFLNLGDSYAGGGRGGNPADSAFRKQATNFGSLVKPTPLAATGLKAKDLMMVPNRLAIRLQDDGWYVRSEIIWAKPNPMPESVKGSHFTRHMVTINDYERLSGLPYADECAGDDWAGDMPSLSEAEIPQGKAPLSAKRQRQSDDLRSGGTGGREGNSAQGVSLGGGESQTVQVSEDGERQDESAQEGGRLSGQREGKAKVRREASSNEGYACQNRSEETCCRGLRQNGKDDRQEAQRLCEAESRDCSGGTIHGGNVVGPNPQAQGALPLLQTEADSDARSCDPCDEGGKARGGKYRPGVSVVQFQEGRPDRSSLLVGCPGCELCAMHHGYIFHLSAGRPTSAHEKIWLLTKGERYWYDAEAIAEAASQPQGIPKLTAQHKASAGGFTTNGTGSSSLGSNQGEAVRNARNVWTIASQPYSAHFATMPPALAERCILAGCPIGGYVLDPFGGAGTTALVADRLGRDGILIELNPEYAAMAEARIRGDAGMFASVGG